MPAAQLHIEVAQSGTKTETATETEPASPTATMTESSIHADDDSVLISADEAVAVAPVTAMFKVWYYSI